MASFNLPMFLDPKSNACPPPDVTFVLTTKDDEVVEVKAHKLILAFASDVFNREFYGSLSSEDIIHIKDSSHEVFELFIAFIYSKQLKWKDYDLAILSSLYYLAEKYNVKVLREEIITFIPEYKIKKEHVLEVATLAEENILNPELSQALYLSASTCLKSEFGGEIKKVYDFVTRPGVNESHAVVIFKLLCMMKTVKIEHCENCTLPTANCLNGQGITFKNFVPGAKVNPTNLAVTGFQERVKRLVCVISDREFTGTRLDGTVVENLHLSPEYYKYEC